MALKKKKKNGKRQKKTAKERKEKSYHLQCPHAPDPHLEASLDAVDLVELRALPPAAARRLAPEEQQLLRHADGMPVGQLVAAYVRAQARQRQAADDGLVGLAGAVAPIVVVVEASGKNGKEGA